MKKISVLVMIMVLVMRVYGYIPSNIVENIPRHIPSSTVENIPNESRDSEFDELMIEKAKKNPEFYTLKEEVKVKIEEEDVNLAVNGEEGILVANGEEVILDISNVVAQDRKKMLALNGKVNRIFNNKSVAINQIVNIGRKMWNMVAKNEAILELKTKYAVALPMGVENPRELSGWLRPKSHVISFYIENIFGIDVIKVSYRVTYLYGGSYQGRGKYLTAVSAIPKGVDVLFPGVHFNMEAQVPDSTVVNVGTSDNPIAALQLNVRWSASTYFQKLCGTDVYYIQGDGHFERK